MLRRDSSILFKTLPPKYEWVIHLRMAPEQVSAPCSHELYRQQQHAHTSATTTTTTTTTIIITITTTPLSPPRTLPPQQTKIYAAFLIDRRAQIEHGDFRNDILTAFHTCRCIINHPDILIDAVHNERAALPQDQWDLGRLGWFSNVPGMVRTPRSCRNSRGGVVDADPPPLVFVVNDCRCTGPFSDGVPRSRESQQCWPVCPSERGGVFACDLTAPSCSILREGNLQDRHGAGVNKAARAADHPADGSAAGGEARGVLAEHCHAGHPGPTLHPATARGSR